MQTLQRRMARRRRGDCGNAKEGVSAEKDPDTVLYVQRRSGTEWAWNAEQRGEDGPIEARAEGRAGVRVLLYMAVANAGWRARDVAYSRAAILLRQHEAMRAGNGQYAGGAGISEEDGIGMGGICRDGESEQSGAEVGAY